MNLADHGLSSTAMVLAAGLGARMRPLTLTRPKPLVAVAGRPLIDHVLDRLCEAGVARAAVNVHWLADQIEAHLARRRRPEIVISDERAGLLDSGGGARKVLDLLGPRPFLLANSDTLWIDGARSNVRRLVEHWDPARMDALLLLAATATSIGFDGRGDFTCAADGRLARRAERQIAPFAYAGFAILKPEQFEGMPEGAFSLNRVFDRALAADRLHGVRLDGVWMHVGTPEALREAEEFAARNAA
jgi:MurNAc alpha-1-phosphate uridylyltransferase